LVSKRGFFVAVRFGRVPKHLTNRNFFSFAKIPEQNRDIPSFGLFWFELKQKIVCFEDTLIRILIRFALEYAAASGLELKQKWIFGFSRKAKIYEISLYFASQKFVLSLLSCSGSLVLCFLSWMYCSDCLFWRSCPGCPVLAIVFRLSCPGYRVLAVLSWPFCPGCPIPAVLCQLSCPSNLFHGSPDTAVLALLSCPDCPLCSALGRLSKLSSLD
jgi:hypothetical protein